VIRKDLKQLFCRQITCELFKTDRLPAELSYRTNCHLHCFVTTAKKWMKWYKLGEFNSSHQKMEALHDAMADSFTTMAAEQSGSFCLIILFRRLSSLF
jgi:hypothetical protein